MIFFIKKFLLVSGTCATTRFAAGPPTHRELCQDQVISDNGNKTAYINFLQLTACT